MPLVMLKSDARTRLKPCLRCGYSLRNNIDARNCPECGLAVRITLRGDDSLAWSNPAWLRRTALAMGVILFAHVGFLATVALIQILQLSVREFRSFSIPSRRLFLATGILASVSAVVFGIGAFLLAAFEGRYPDRLRAHRVWLRITAGLLVPVAGWDLAQYIHRLRPMLPGWLDFVAMVACALAVWAYLHAIERRVPNRRGMHFIECVASILGVAVVLLPFAGFPTWVPILMRAMPWERPAWPWTVGTLVYVPLATALTVRCGWHLRAAMRDANENWVTDP